MDCFQDHRKLGIAIYGHTLKRWARSSKHMLRIGAGPIGGAWGFLVDLLDKHPEVWEIQVDDRDTGTLWEIDRATFEKHSYRRDLGKGMQLICNVVHWRHSNLSMQATATTQATATEPAPRQPEQGSLFAMTGHETYRGRRIGQRRA